MKRIVLFTLLAFSITGGNGQALSAENLFSLSSYSNPKKFDNYLSRNGFAFAGRSVQNDTLLQSYLYKRTKNFSTPDSINRTITRADVKEQTFITFETESFTEIKHLANELKKKGFICTRELAAIDSTMILFQLRDLTVEASLKNEDTVRKYSLVFHKKVFPKPGDIYYADDLLAFTSHEYLVHYFGENNVKKDIYFFSGNEIAKCSVLFLNTDRQVVFIWGDEENRCKISSLLLGGQQNLQSSIESGKYVEENSWALKSGIRPGMSLMELRLLNGTDFRFYGGSSPNSGSVIPGETGKIDFKKEEVILACLNCKDDKFTMAKVINADDSIDEGRILFVLSVILNPM